MRLLFCLCIFSVSNCIYICLSVTMCLLYSISIYISSILCILRTKICVFFFHLPPFGILITLVIHRMCVLSFCLYDYKVAVVFISYTATNNIFVFLLFVFVAPGQRKSILNCASPHEYHQSNV